MPTAAPVRHGTAADPRTSAIGHDGAVVVMSELPPEVKAVIGRGTFRPAGANAFSFRQDAAGGNCRTEEVGHDATRTRHDRIYLGSSP
ncbi:MAG: hypothetical protein CMD83_01820 [Gammaproteobacteria bacterium]|nr:hypothetical protein [Gammaproteobacteria bacterium]